MQRAQELPITNLLSLLRSLYDLTFYENLICPQVIIYKAPGPLPWGMLGVVILKDIISGPLNYIEQNGYLKIFI